MGLGYGRSTTENFDYVQEGTPLKKGSIFDLFQGHSYSNQEKVSIFSFDKSKGQTRTKIAQNGSTKLKTIRHYGIVKYFGSKDSHTEILVATEPVIPLSSIIGELIYEEVFLGFYQLVSTLAFLHKACTLSHCNISVNTIYVNPSDSSDWKLADFGFASNLGETNISLLEECREFQETNSIPPEYAQNSTYSSVTAPFHSRDTWAVGCLLEELSNSINQLKQNQSAVNIIKRLKSEDPTKRPLLDDILEDSFFGNNKLINVIRFMKEIAIQTSEKKEEFFKSLPATLKILPTNTLVRVVVPRLLKYQIMIQPEVQQFLPYFLVPAPQGILPKSDYEKQIAPFLCWALGQSNRHLRSALLNILKQFVGHITKEQRQEIFDKLLQKLVDPDEVHVPEIIDSLLVITKFMSQNADYEKINMTVRPMINLATNNNNTNIRISAFNFLSAIFQVGNIHLPLEEITSVFQTGLFDPSVRHVAVKLGSALTTQLPPRQSIAILQSLVPLLIDNEVSVREEARNNIVTMVNHLVPYNSQTTNSNSNLTPTKPQIIHESTHTINNEVVREISQQNIFSVEEDEKSTEYQEEDDEWDDWGKREKNPVPIKNDKPPISPIKIDPIPEEKNIKPPTPTSTKANSFFEDMDPEIGGLEATPTITIQPKQPTIVPKKSQRLLVAEEEGVGTGWGEDELSMEDEINQKKDSPIEDFEDITTKNKNIKNENKDDIVFKGWGEDDLDLEDFNSSETKPKLDPISTSKPLVTSSGTSTGNSNPKYVKNQIPVKNSVPTQEKPSYEEGYIIPGFQNSPTPKKPTNEREFQKTEFSISNSSDLEDNLKSSGSKLKIDPVLTANSHPFGTSKSHTPSNVNPDFQNLHPTQKNEGDVQKSAPVESRGGRKGPPPKQKRDKPKVEKTTFSFDD